MENTPIYAAAPDEKELNYINETMGLPKDVIYEESQMNEGRRIFRTPKGQIATYLFVPQKMGDYDYRIQPAVLISTLNEKVVIAPEKLDFLENFMESSINEDISSETIHKITDRYLDVLGEISISIQSVIDHIKKNPKESDMMDVFSLQVSIIRLDSAVDSLQLVLEQGVEKGIFRSQSGISEVKIQLVHASRTVDTYISILQSAIDLIEGIINNRLNDIMKFLTAMTLILSIPMAIAGFWGMNVPVPMASSPRGFMLLILLSIVLSVVSTFWLIQKKFM